MSTVGNQSASLGSQSNLGSQSSTDDLRRKAGDVKQSVQDLSTTARAAAEEKLGELKDSASQYYEMGRERVYDAEQSVEDYIRDQPVKAVLIAAGLGFLFGACYMRR